jgi:hypothetical protein
MKVFIDKHGGMHYHRKDCKAIQPNKNPPQFKYEEIEHQVRHMPNIPDYTDIIVEGRRYSPCLFCFGD